MTVAAEVEAEIARLFHAEHWKMGTIVAESSAEAEARRDADVGEWTRSRASAHRIGRGALRGRVRPPP